MSPGPYSPFIYWPHVVLGIASVFLVIVAIFAAKGSKLHRQTGRFFAIFMGIAAITAIGFAIVRTAPAPIISSLIAIYSIGAGWLTLRKRSGPGLWLQRILVLVPVLLTIFVLGNIVGGANQGVAALVFGIIILGPLAALFALMAWGDIRYLRSEQDDRFRQFRRHALRMAVAASEVLRAPLMSFGPPLGALTFPVYFVGPFLLVPLIYFLAMPRWIKEREQRRPNMPTDDLVTDAA